jgi:hypothetical protein
MRMGVSRIPTHACLNTCLPGFSAARPGFRWRVCRGRSVTGSGCGFLVGVIWLTGNINAPWPWNSTNRREGDVAVPGCRLTTGVVGIGHDRYTARHWRIFSKDAAVVGQNVPFFVHPLVGL